jgi:hypothetical protein
MRKHKSSGSLASFLGTILQAETPLLSATSAGAACVFASAVNGSAWRSQMPGYEHRVLTATEKGADFHDPK